MTTTTERKQARYFGVELPDRTRLTRLTLRGGYPFAWAVRVAAPTAVAGAEMRYRAHGFSGSQALAERAARSEASGYTNARRRTADGQPFWVVGDVAVLGTIEFPSRRAMESWSKGAEVTA